MGKYINIDSKGGALPRFEKAEALLKDGAEHTDASYKEDLVVVVHHGHHDAAGYMYSKEEFEYFNNCNIKGTWLVYPHAKELTK